MKKKIIILVVVLVFIVPLLSGCVDMVPVTTRGGGWMPYYGEYDLENPMEGVGRTTFGFNVDCYNAVYNEAEDEWTYDVRGHFVYKDKDNGILIKGKVTNATYWEGAAIFVGEYTIGELTGEFMVGVYDDFVLLNEDVFSIQLTGDIHDGYINSGPISSGNITLVYPQ